MKPILFLDIDGVLNTNTPDIEPDKVELLNDVFKAVDCEVVLSSTWRIKYELPIMVDILDVAGFLGNLVAYTRNLGCKPHQDGGWYECKDAHRGHEILDYLVERFRTGKDGWPKFVILDDSADMNPLMDNLVRTKWNIGLERSHVTETIRRLR